MSHHAHTPRSRLRAVHNDDPTAVPPGPASRSRLLSAEDVGHLLGVTPAFVYALVRRGELPAVHVGDRYVRFRAEALQDWIAERESATPRGAR